MHALFSLANNPERLMRLINHLSDKGFELTSQCKASALHQTVKAVFTFSLDESLEIALAEEQPCQDMRIHLDANRPDLELIRLILEAGGEICDDPGESDLVVCDTCEINALRERHPRKLVISEAEFSALLRDSVQADRLRAPVNPDLTPVPRLPDNLKACWAKLRRRSIPTINEGLELLEALLQTDSTAADPLLDQVEVVDGALFPGRRFRLSDAFTHPYSYYALLGILSRCPAGSRGEALRLGIKILNQPWNVYEPLSIIILPQLWSFKNLETINIHVLEPDRTRPSACLSTCWLDLSSLTELSLSVADGVTIQLDHLDAPKLERLTLVGQEFKEITGLSQCVHLSSIDIQGTSVADLSPIAAACEALRNINIAGTDITTLEPLSGCRQINNLNTDHCKRLVNLRGLEQAVVTADPLYLRNAPIESLRWFPFFEGSSLTLWHLPLSDLAGIDKVKTLKRLDLIDLQRLSSIAELLSLTTLEEVVISGCGALDDLRVLGNLPNLRRVSISGCTKLLTMPERWPESLRQLSLADLATRQIGDLPSAYEDDLNLQTVHGLETVANLRLSTQMPEVLLTMSAISKVRDLMPLACHQDLWINIKMEGSSRLPDSVVDMLSKLPACRLRLDDYVDLDLNNLTRLDSLIALDLDVNYMWIKKDELRPILGMNALEYLQFSAGSLPELGGCTFNSASKIAKLKMQLLVS